MSKYRKEERKQIALENAEASAKRSTQEKIDLAKKRRGNSAKELGRLRALLRKKD